MTAGQGERTSWACARSLCSVAPAWERGAVVRWRWTARRVYSDSRVQRDAGSSSTRAEAIRDAERAARRFR
jgi:hypothetical protein